MTELKVFINIWGLLDENTRGKAANDPTALKTLYDTNREWHDALLEDVFNEICSLYERSIDDSEAYVHNSEIEDENMHGICFGFMHPKSVVLTARGWNGDIRQKFADAVLTLQKNHTPDGKLPLDNPFTYAVKKAAMALDNDFYPYAEQAVALNETNNYFECIIDEKKFAEIAAYPERYAVAVVYVN